MFEMQYTVMSNKAHLPDVQYPCREAGIIKLIDIVLLKWMIGSYKTVESIDGQQPDTVSCRVPQTPGEQQLHDQLSVRWHCRVLLHNVVRLLQLTEVNYCLCHGCVDENLVTHCTLPALVQLHRVLITSGPTTCPN